MRFQRGHKIGMTGKHHSEKTKEKISQSLKNRFIGKNHPNWKGGLWNNKEYYNKQRRKYRHKIGESKKFISKYGGESIPKKEWRQRRKALEKGGGDLSIRQIQMVYEDNIKKYGTLTCIYCLKSIEFGKDTLEHKIPLSRNGTNEYKNLAIACKSCNSSKRNKTEIEFRKEKMLWLN